MWPTARQGKEAKNRLSSCEQELKTYMALPAAQMGWPQITHLAP